jgi:hypothetical protein
MWLTCTNKSYDFAYTREAHGVKGRFHHITYALDSREDVLRAADVFLENGVHIETGPHKHAVQRTVFLYVYEPGAPGLMWRMRVHVSGWLRIGSRSSGRRRSARRAKRGVSRSSRASTHTAHHRCLDRDPYRGRTGCRIGCFQRSRSHASHSVLFHRWRGLLNQGMHGRWRNSEWCRLKVDW